MTFTETQEPSTIRQAIYDHLKTVDSIGNVQAFQRYSKRNSDLAKFYSWTNPNNDTQDYESEIRGWFITRDSFRQDLDAGCYERTTVWSIQGFMSLDDDTHTELQFEHLCDAIEAAFREDGTLAGAISSIGDENEQGLQLIDSGPTVFAGVLCHGAKFRLVTRH